MGMNSTFREDPSRNTTDACQHETHAKGALRLAFYIKMPVTVVGVALAVVTIVTVYRQRRLHGKFRVLFCCLELADLGFMLCVLVTQAMIVVVQCERGATMWMCRLSQICLFFFYNVSVCCTFLIAGIRLLGAVAQTCFTRIQTSGIMTVTLSLVVILTAAGATSGALLGGFNRDNMVCSMFTVTSRNGSFIQGTFVLALSIAIMSSYIALHIKLARLKKRASRFSMQSSATFLKEKKRKEWDHVLSTLVCLSHCVFFLPVGAFFIHLGNVYHHLEDFHDAAELTYMELLPQLTFYVNPFVFLWQRARLRVFLVNWCCCFSCKPVGEDSKTMSSMHLDSWTRRISMLRLGKVDEDYKRHSTTSGSGQVRHGRVSFSVEQAPARIEDEQALPYGHTITSFTETPSLRSISQRPPYLHHKLGAQVELSPIGSMSDLSISDQTTSQNIGPLTPKTNHSSTTLDSSVSGHTSLKLESCVAESNYNLLECIGLVDIHSSKVDSLRPYTEDSLHPSKVDSPHPSMVDSPLPSKEDSLHPSKVDSPHLSKVNALHPSKLDSPHPSKVNSLHPSKVDSQHPSKVDALHPSKVDAQHPTKEDSLHPSKVDALRPSKVDSSHPSKVDALHPSKVDAQHPTKKDSLHPSKVDALHPSKVDSPRPSKVDALHPSKVDSPRPSKVDALHPSKVDSPRPSKVDALHPSKVDAQHPTKEGSLHPSKVDALHSDSPDSSDSRNTNHSSEKSTTV